MKVILISYIKNITININNDVSQYYSNSNVYILVAAVKSEKTSNHKEFGQLMID